MGRFGGAEAGFIGGFFGVSGFVVGEFGGLGDATGKFGNEATRGEIVGFRGEFEIGGTGGFTGRL